MPVIIFKAVADTWLLIFDGFIDIAIKYKFNTRVRHRLYSCININQNKSN